MALLNGMLKRGEVGQRFSRRFGLRSRSGRRRGLVDLKDWLSLGALLNALAEEREVKEDKEDENPLVMLLLLLNRNAKFSNI